MTDQKVILLRKHLCKGYSGTIQAAGRLLFTQPRAEDVWSLPPLPGHALYVAEGSGFQLQYELRISTADEKHRGVLVQISERQQHSLPQAWQLLFGQGNAFL